MKAALAAASDGGYYVGRVNASAGRVRPGSWVSLAVKTEAAFPLEVAVLLEFHGPVRPDLSLPPS